MRFFRTVSIIAFALAPLAVHSQGGGGSEKTAQYLRGHNGASYRFRCPASGIAGTIWGTGVYTDNSSVCTAAIHAGKITPASGGIVLIRILPGRAAYSGSSRHGITSLAYGRWRGSFAVVGAQPMTSASAVATPPPKAAPAVQTDNATSSSGTMEPAPEPPTYAEVAEPLPPGAAPTLPSEAAASGTGWQANAVKLRGRNNQRFTFVCTAHGDLGTVWGTGVYTDDSSICTAAVHAGIITQSGGGAVRIEIRPGQSSYNGSSQNGVDSQAFGSWGGSFVFVRS